MFKKMVALFVLCSLVLSMGIAYGDEKIDNDIVAYRLETCPTGCGGGLIVTKTYGKWYNTGNGSPCSHYPFGLDYIYTRAVTTDRNCNTCSYGYTNTSQ